MASNIKFLEAMRNNMLDQVDVSLGASPLLRIYDGTQPTNVATALGAQVLLAQLAMTADAFPAASGGTITASSITDDSSADSDGTATWGTLTTAGGVRVVDFSVSTSAADLNLNTTSIQSGATVSVSSFVISIPA